MDNISIYKLLATIHDQIEDSILCFIKPKTSLYSLRIFIENQIDSTMAFLESKEKGIAFPVGLNLNNCAAHDSPLDSKDTRIISDDDVLKVDYGIHINGYILDAAFTICFKEKYRDLLETTRKACMEAAQLFYPNTQISKISGRIQSVVSNKFFVLKNLCGHQIQPYRIHSGKVIPNIIIPYHEKILEGEVYTVEPYLTNSKNKGETFVSNFKDDISHYMFNYHEKNFEQQKYLQLIPSLAKHKTLAFHRNWLNEADRKYLDSFIEKSIYKEYPPIFDKDKKSKIAQFETTIIVTNGAPIILKTYDSIDKYILKI